MKLFPLPLLCRLQGSRSGCQTGLSFTVLMEQLSIVLSGHGCGVWCPVLTTPFSVVFPLSAMLGVMHRAVCVTQREELYACTMHTLY